MSKRILTLSTFLILLINPSDKINAQVKIYPIDSWHSYVRFNSKFGGTIDVPGTFNAFSGAVAFNDSDISKLSATIIIEAKSIDTNLELRDTHLKEESYLAVDKYPLIKFTSTNVKKKKGKYYLSGELEFHGVKKNVDVSFQKIANEKLDPWKNPRVTFRGEFIINRRDFGIEGDAAIADEVRIELNISARIFGMETQGLFKRPFGEQIWSSIHQNGVEAAIKLFKELQTKNDSDAKRYLSLNFVAMRLEEENRTEDALKFYELGVLEFPGHDVAYSNLANAYFRKNLKDPSLEASHKALNLNPDNTIALEIKKYYKSTSK